MMLVISDKARLLSKQIVYSSAVWPDWVIYWTLGNFFKPLATINLPKSYTFLGNFCKGVKIFHFSSEIIFGQFKLSFGNFFLVTLVPTYILVSRLICTPIDPCDIQTQGSFKACLKAFPDLHNLQCKTQWDRGSWLAAFLCIKNTTHSTSFYVVCLNGLLDRLAIKLSKKTIFDYT